MLQRFKKFALSVKAKKAVVLGMCMTILSCMFSLSASAADASTASTPAEAASEIFTTVSSSINVGQIVTIIGIALGTGVGLYLAWWAIRKVVRMVKNGLNGKLKI